LVARVTRGKKLRRMKKYAIDIRSSSNLKRKNFEDTILLVKGFKELNEFIIELKSNIHQNSIIKTQLDNPCPSHSELGEKQSQETD
jgi:hypothetical protein